MKFLADENIGSKVVQFLRNQGYDVVSAIETMKSAKDTEILLKAVREERILLTTDKDFGEMVFLKKLTPVGVILLRLRDNSAPHKIAVLADLLACSSTRLKGRFFVVTEEKIRSRKI